MGHGEIAKDNTVIEGVNGSTDGVRDIVASMSLPLPLSSSSSDGSTGGAENTEVFGTPSQVFPPAQVEAVIDTVTSTVTDNGCDDIVASAVTGSVASTVVGDCVSDIVTSSVTGSVAGRDVEYTNTNLMMQNVMWMLAAAAQSAQTGHDSAPQNAQS